MVSQEELEILAACLGSSEPYDRIILTPAGLRSASETLSCEIQRTTLCPFTGSVPGVPWIKFHQFSLKEGQEVQHLEKEGSLTLSSSSGKVKLPLSKNLSSNPFVKSAQADSEKPERLHVTPELLQNLERLIDTNGSTELQVLKMDMLGAVLTEKEAYCLSLQALVANPGEANLPKGYSRVLLPSKFIQLLCKAARHYQALLVELELTPSRIAAKFFLDLEQEHAAPLRLSSAVPIIDNWVDILPVKAAQGFIVRECPIDLSGLASRLSLLDLTGMDKVTLSHTGARCSAAHADVEIPFDLPLEQPITVPLQKFAKILQLCPTMTTYDSVRRLLVLSGDNFIAYLISL